MKRFMQIWMGILATLVLSTMAMADGGNQLMQNQTHWYEKAAETVAPARGVSTQSGTLLTVQAGSVLYMVGGSTLHEYQMNAHSLRGSAVLKGSAKDLAKALKSGQVGAMSLAVPLDTFKSRESGLDDNADKALKAKENPEIQFELKKAKLKAGTTEGTYVLTATGTLTIAGESKPITLTGDATFTDNQLRFKGVQKLKMTDFKITPPSISLVVTSITCTDDIEVHYDVIFGAK